MSASHTFDVAPTAHYRQTVRPLRAPQRRQIASVQPLPVPAQRVASVDALRGFSMFCILGMDSLAKALEQLLANTTPFLAALGAAFATQFTHVEWEGVYFYDLIFPLFIFVTGVAIVFSLNKLVATEGKAAAHKRVLRRSILLFVLGIICYGGISDRWADIRLMGVLQRIAICYLFASLLFLNLSLRGLIAAFVGLLGGYWALMTFVPVPHIGAGSFEEGRNLANWVDANYLPGRKWNGTWDPEGLLSTIPAIGTCMLGVFAGLVLKNPAFAPKQKSLLFIVAGIAMICAGYLWGLQFPVIKYIWTSSFVLVAGGFAVLLLGVFHYLMDVRGYKAWANMFMWVGASAIVLYVFNMVFGFNVIAQRLVGGDFSNLLNRWIAPGAGEFLVAAVGLSLAVATAHFLYRRKIFLRV
jgi:predicted acyltransferase